MVCLDMFSSTTLVAPHMKSVHNQKIPSKLINRVTETYSCRMTFIQVMLMESTFNLWNIVEVLLHPTTTFLYIIMNTNKTILCIYLAYSAFHLSVMYLTYLCFFGHIACIQDCYICYSLCTGISYCAFLQTPPPEKTSSVSEKAQSGQFTHLGSDVQK